MNVLIVDDDAMWSNLAAALLRSVAVKIRMTSTYAEAMETIRKPNGYDVVMLDLSLPDSPPKTTVDRIQEIKDTGRKVIVVLTGQQVDEPLRKAVQAKGALDCISKDDIHLADKLKAMCA